MNGHTFKLFSNIYNGFIIESEMDIHMFKHNYSKNCILILYQLRAKNHFFD